jgi:titin
VISGNGAGGVQITGSGTTGNQLVDNTIGTDPSGTLALGNGQQEFEGPGTGDGVYIAAGASDNTLAGNLISGSLFNGVHIAGSGTTGNKVQNNTIGPNISVSAPLGNQLACVAIDSGATGNLVGGTDPSSCNVISGNRGVGIAISSPGATGNQVQGNYIGTDATGSAAMPNGGNGIGIYGASGNFIGDIVAGAGNVISGNTGNGVYIGGTTASGNLVRGNRIGTSADGMAALGNDSGVAIAAGANGKIVGDIGFPYSNLISGNRVCGVLIIGAGTNHNAVERNRIGTNIDGAGALGGTYGVLLDMGTSFNSIGDSFQDYSGNQIWGNGDGVVIQGGAHDNTVGGVGFGGNLISANTEIGVGIFGSGTTNNKVLGNVIGTASELGLTAAPNHYGVAIEAGASNNTIGGTGAGAGNLISGNTAFGIEIDGTGTTNNVVQGNDIGIGPNSFPANATVFQNLVPNGTGVLISGGASNNTVGGTVLGAANVISDNLHDGIDIQGSGTTGNLVQGNQIGTDSSGQKNGGNMGDGVRISSTASNNTIGGPGAGNIIAFSAGAGVDGRDSSSVGDPIQANAIFGNHALGIDLGGDGVTLNTPRGPHTGPNDLQSFPDLMTYLISGPSASIAYTLNSTPNASFTIEFYANEAPDRSSHGQGLHLVGDDRRHGQCCRFVYLHPLPGRALPVGHRHPDGQRPADRHLRVLGHAGARSIGCNRRQPPDRHGCGAKPSPGSGPQFAAALGCGVQQWECLDRFHRPQRLPANRHHRIGGERNRSGKCARRHGGYRSGRHRQRDGEYQPNGPDPGTPSGPGDHSWGQQLAHAQHLRSGRSLTGCLHADRLRLQ